MADNFADTIKKAIQDAEKGLTNVTAGHDPMESGVPLVYSDPLFDFKVEPDTTTETDAAGFAVIQPEKSKNAFEVRAPRIAAPPDTEHAFIKSAKLDKRLGQITEKADKLISDQRKTVRSEREALVKATEKTLSLRKEQLAKLDEARVKDTLKKVSGKFVVAGRLLDKETGAPLVGVKLVVHDLDRKKDDKITEAYTDSAGYYRVEYSAKDLNDPDKKPEIYIEVMDEHQEVVYKSPRSFIEKSGEVQEINVTLDKGVFENSRAIGERFVNIKTNHDAVLDKRLSTLDHRKAVLLTRAGDTKARK